MMFAVEEMSEEINKKISPLYSIEILKKQSMGIEFPDSFAIRIYDSTREDNRNYWNSGYFSHGIISFALSFFNVGIDMGMRIAKKKLGGER